MKPIVYFLEANIGAGKTTILKKLEKLDHPKIKIIYEPVDLWIKYGLLDKFYNDKTRYSYTFQNFAFITKIVNLTNLDPNYIYIVERSPFVDKNVFAKLCYDKDLMNDTEWNIYNYWFDNLIKFIDIDVKYIYLDTKPDICFDRIKLRDRHSETNINIEYLNLLNDYTNTWLSNLNSTIIKLDGNTNNNYDDNIKQLIREIF
jgi:deoxyadenosine/deoxycytidine kinase